MMPRLTILTVMFVGAMSTVLRANGPAESVVESEQVLSELMAIPARQIPRQLLAQAEGIAIIPNVIKVGFVGAARRGHGVVMVRDDEGEWSLPQFVTLTGGSVGFQAGIQGADVVLVFTTRKSVRGLMEGKFTIGVDASAAAGPIGRDAAIGTDATLLSEIYSYSRSRGLFLGVAIDGSVLEINHGCHAMYYGSPSNELPARIPQPATELRDYLAELTPKKPSDPADDLGDVPVSSRRQIENLRRSLTQHAGHLHSQLNSEWRRYLALPSELQTADNIPPREKLERVIERYSHVSVADEYQNLAKNPEFQRTFELLVEYDKSISAAGPKLDLPLPPEQ